MSFHTSKVLTGAAITLVACLAAVSPSMANPMNQSTDGLLLSQENRPENEGVPQLLNNDEVQGRVTRINGDKVEMQLSTGERRTYTISQDDQERNRLQVGSEVVLTVRGDAVLAIRPASSATTSTGAGGTSSTTSGTARSTESSGSSSSTVIRRETTVQQTRPAPAPAVDDDDDAAQPVRGLW
jgi:antitoxin (DNA-binding transcriptional repressor) of toxin-antitoxin stability system